MMDDGMALELTRTLEPMQATVLAAAATLLDVVDTGSFRDANTTGISRIRRHLLLFFLAQRSLGFYKEGSTFP